MIIYFRDILDENFIKEFVPQIIRSKAFSLAKKRNVSQMNEYLKKNFDLTIDEVIEQIRFSFNHYGNIYSLAINNNIYEEKTNEKVISLVKLIDYGNLEVKGLNIINSSMYYVNNNLKGLYRYYQMKGGEQ